MPSDPAAGAGGAGLAGPGDNWGSLAEGCTSWRLLLGAGVPGLQLGGSWGWEGGRASGGFPRDNWGTLAGGRSGEARGTTLREH